MKVTLFVALAALLASPCASSQATATGRATTKGACSPAVSGNKNMFIIRCGVNPKEGEKMLEIMNRILASQLDPAAVMTKLDEILRETRPTETVNAPYGIGSIGGTLVNPTVNNYGVPRANLTFTEEIASGPVASKDRYQVLKVHIKTDRSIPGAEIGIVFSDAVEVIKENGFDSGPRLGGATEQQLSWTTPLSRNGVQVPNSYGFRINAPSAFVPGMELTIPVKSKELVHVLMVAPVGH